MWPGMISLGITTERDNAGLGGGKKYLRTISKYLNFILKLELELSKVLFTPDLKLIQEVHYMKSEVGLLPFGFFV